MLKEYLYTYLILGLAQGSSYDQPMDNHILCMDCTEKNKECPIQETGYSVLKETARFARGIRGFYAPMVKCLPLGLQINATTFDALCVWSPKLGCQVIINKFRKVQMFCRDCIPPFEPPNDTVKRCPCHGYRLVDSGSEDPNCGVPLKFLIAFYLVQRLIVE